MRVFLILLWLTCNTVFAQQYSMRNYKAVDGLPQSQVSSMVEDQNGYLWVGTEGGGLARFDGHEFRVYTTLDGLLSNTIHAMQIDAHQNIWIVHPRGLTKFDGHRFKKIAAPAQRSITKLFDVRDTLYFQVGAQGMSGKIVKDSMVSFNEPLVEGKRVNYSVRSQSRTICYYISDSSFLLISPDGKRTKLSFNGLFTTVKTMTSYFSNILLDTDKGYYVFDVKNKNFFHAEIAVDGKVIAYDSITKNFWTETGGSIYRQKVGWKPELVISDIPVRQILFDREGSVWVATSGRGLFKYFVRDFDKCTSDQLGAVMAIAKDKSGATWIGGRAVIKMQQGKITKYPMGSGGITNRSEVMDIKINKKGEVWVASLAGLGRYDSIKDKFKWYTREDGLSSQYISSLDFDDQGNVWCGSVDGGLNLFDGKVFKNYSLKDKLGGRGIFSLRYFSKLKTMFACYESGIKAIKGNVIDKIELPELTNSPVLSTSIYKDSVLLLGSSGSGILVFDPVTKSKKMISSKDGLPSNLIYFVGPDEANYVWVGTEQGVSRLRFGKDFEITEIQNFGYDNGLTGVETNQNAYYLSKKEKYFGLVDGVYQYNKRRQEFGYSYPLHLMGVEVSYGETSSRKYADSLFGFFKIPYKPEFPSDKNHITFYFNRVAKLSPRSIRYKYFLENFDKTWSFPTDRGWVTYGNLPPGNYVFQVKAINYQGVWDKEPLKYGFTITAPFYQTATFSVLVFCFVVGLIVIVSYSKVRARIRKTVEIERIRQQEQENLRKEIARDFHDEMGNQLTRIINYISLMKLSPNGHAKEFYNKVEISAKYLYTGTRDFIWSIDPVNDELSKLFFHIRDFGEKLFEEKGIHFRAYNELDEKVKLPYGFSREANLIIKEAMTNSFNHSNAKNVSFTLRKTADGYSMDLVDDGKGFSVNGTARSNGLGNMNVRASRIKSIVKIESEENKGTEIHLLIPEFKTQHV
ncbi:MAG TPA: two-component regulator propeller domain-containing protein [Cyclobacteriaceae bacterium]|nr:two-component regulator propeller domain-containing protein [Cyclobacteriaceae bacterium]